MTKTQRYYAIWGIILNESLLKKLAKKLDLSYIFTLDDPSQIFTIFGQHDLVTEVIEKQDARLICLYDIDLESLIIGQYAEGMYDEETLGFFKERIVEELECIGIELNIDEIQLLKGESY